MKYVKLAILQKGNHIDTLYTYECENDEVRPGDKVCVPFGLGNRQKDAFVFEVADSAEGSRRSFKQVSRLISGLSLPEEMMAMACWMRERYLCTYTEAISSCTPPAIKKQRERMPHRNTPAEDMNIQNLTGEQKAAIESIDPHIKSREHRTFLLHGVTGSGKTEVYLQIIDKVIKKGRSAILLVPEISLTIQTIRRFKGRFGAENIAVLHSKLSAGERFDQWMKIRAGEIKIVVGARSAIFAPLENIGAIIIDEEHEGTYKSEQSPKYDAIEAAEYRAAVNGAVLVLGSATPSIGTYYKAQAGIYEILRLKERYNKNPLPVLETADMREELKNGNKTMFSVALYKEIRRCTDNGQSVILFLNKRGYSSFVSCRSCGYAMKCPDCGISMTYHKSESSTICHFCGYREKVPKLCPVCGSKYIRHFGTGTERLEEATKMLFPDLSVARLDLDTTRKKGSIESILSDFQKGKTQILIGTQIVAKGLDFKTVGLVGIIAADLSLHIPDFRSAERTYQLITQAAGRAGRGDLRGKVIIQTYEPENHAVKCALTQDYVALFREEVSVRKQAGYPPFVDIILITVAATSETQVREGMATVLIMLVESMGCSVIDKILGPKAAYLYKIKDRYRRQVIIKSEKQDRMQYMQTLAEIKKVFYGAAYQDYQFLVDVNPYSVI